jgi:arylsulfatase A-like enzyme
VRRDVLMVVGLGTVLSVGSLLAITPASVSADSGRPDVIAVMVDDLGYVPRNSVLERLPNIRSTFIDGGLELQRMYGQTPLCSPGRANFLTGQNSLRNGVIKNNSAPVDTSKTVARALKKSGYHTSLVGKYFIDWDETKKPGGWSEASIFRDTERLQAESLDALARAPKSKPLFAWISATAPHRCRPQDHPGYDCAGPYVPERHRGAAECAGIEPFKPPTYRSWAKPRPFPRNMPDRPDGWDLVQICESMLQVDEMLGAVKAAQQGRDRPVYYVFFSDNGMAWGQKGFPAKHVPPATQLPMFVAGPGVARGAKSGKLLSIIDIAPTIAALGKTRMPSADGRSFKALLRGKAFSGRKRALEHGFTSRAKWSAVRYKNWRYIRWADGRKQLFHLTQDPWEQKNIVAKKRDLARRLDRELTQMVARSKG